MNNYIIDPAVFYWINVLSIIQTVCAIIGTLSLIGFITLLVLYCWKIHGLSEPEKPDKDDRYEMKSYQRQMRVYHDDLKDLLLTKKYMMLTLIVSCFLIVLAVFIPGKQTSVEMLVARTATFDNVDWTVQQVKEIIDYIVSALKGTV